MIDGIEYSAMDFSSNPTQGTKNKWFHSICPRLYFIVCNTLRHTGRMSLQRQSMICSRRYSENRPKAEAVVYIRESSDVTGTRQARCFRVSNSTSHNAVNITQGHTFI